MFDPAGSVSFDLERGRVELADGDTQVLVPTVALGALLAGQLDARGFGKAIGVGALGRVAARFVPRAPGRGPNVRERLRAASLETAVELLGGELATLGFGSLRVERWGRALLFVLEPCVLEADDLICGVLEGALESVAGRAAHALVVARTEASVRVLVGRESTIARARELVTMGADIAEIVAALHAPSGGADQAGESHT